VTIFSPAYRALATLYGPRLHSFQSVTSMSVSIKLIGRRDRSCGRETVILRTTLISVDASSQAQYQLKASYTSTAERWGAWN
jgi:hypothetical protein